MWHKISVLWIFSCLFSISVMAADEAQSGDDKQKTTDAPLDSPMINTSGVIEGFQPLTIAGQEIDATFIDEKLGEPHGAVVLLHDIGGGIDASGILSTLRTQLPEAGWATFTLALNYPVVPQIYLSDQTDTKTKSNDASKEGSAESQIPATPEKKAETKGENTEEPVAGAEDKDQKKVLPPVSNLQRLESALNFLKDKGIERIIMLGEGEGGILAVRFLGKTKTPVNGLILVSTPQLEKDDYFSKMQFPVVDIYAQRDKVSVLKAVNKRKVIMKREQRNNYVQRKIMGTDQSYIGLEEPMLTVVRGWLKHNFLKPVEQ